MWRNNYPSQAPLYCRPMATILMPHTPPPCHPPHLPQRYYADQCEIGHENPLILWGHRMVSIETHDRFICPTIKTMLSWCQRCIQTRSIDSWCDRLILEDNTLLTWSIRSAASLVGVRCLNRDTSTDCDSWGRQRKRDYFGLYKPLIYPVCGNIY